MISFFTRKNTVSSITAQMTKMVRDLEKLAAKRQALAARELQNARLLEDRAESNYLEAEKATQVASKIGELVA